MQTLLDALVNVQAYLSWPGPLLMFLGILIGTLFGVLPGLAGPQAIALLLPLTIGLNLNQALVLLIATQAATYFSGSLTSILVGIPGTAVNAATIIDGHPLAQQGKAGLAIGASGAASALGGILGAVILMLIIPFAPSLVLAFSYQEFAALGLLGISLISMIGEHKMRSMIAGSVGLLLGTIGFDPLVSIVRFSFGITYLWDGIKIIPAAIGLFGIAESIDLFMQKKAISEVEIVKGGLKGIWQGVASVFRHFFVFLRGTGIGVAIGIIPGIGASVAQFIAYASARYGVKDPSTFGKGDIRGVIAPEASNNAKDGGALVPTLIFGIPGSVDCAILLGVFMIHGVAPGLKMLTETPDIPAAVIMTLGIANLASTLLGFMLAPQLIKLTKIPGTILGAPIIAFAFLGAYAADGIFGDVVVTFIIGILGYYMKKTGFSRVSLIMGLLLGEIIERNFRQAIMTGPAGLTGFITRPISLGLLIAVAILVFWPIFKGMMSGGKKAKWLDSGLEWIYERMIINILFLGIGICFFVVSFSYQYRSGIFPFGIGVITAGLSIVNLAIDWRGFKAKKEEKALGEMSKTWPVLKIFLFLLGLVLALSYINYIATISMFIFLSSMLYGNQRWTRSAVLAGSIGVFVWLIFEVLLHTANL